MRTVAEYLSEAVAFDGFASATPDPALKKRLADIAACYRLLARERQRLVAAGTIPDDEPPQRTRERTG